MYNLDIMYKRLLPVIHNMRYYTQNLCSHMLSTPVKYKSIEKIIPYFVKLSIEEQDKLITINPTLINVQLQLLFCFEPSSKKIFQFICENSKYVHIELAEIHIYNLLVSNNLKAATVLLHKLRAENKEFQLSNELWSYYMDIVCRNSDYLGAMLVFHELIDNIEFYDEITYLVQQNNMLPFLVNTKTLECLAEIFKNNNDPSRVEGILQYFRRFYSFHQYQYTYKTILISIVECYANMKDLSKCLKSFTNLSFAFNQTNIQGKKVISAIKENIQIRNENIQNNLNSITYYNSNYNLDIHQNLLSNICQTNLFNPCMHRNVYSSNKFNGPIPLINGSLYIDDLPNFEKLITNEISKLDMREILHLTKSCHFLIHLFIVSSLCKLGKIEMSLLYLKTISHLFPNKSKKHLIKNQNFITILKFTNNIEFANEVLHFCRSIQNDHVDPNIIKAYVQVLLSNNKTSWNDLREPLSILEKSENNRLTLNKIQYENFLKITENNNNNNYNFIHVHS